MPFLPVLSVVFVGVAGGSSDDKIGQQVQLLLQEHEVKSIAMAAPTVRKLARHAEGSRELVVALHAEGLVGGELAGDPRHRVLRMVIYNGEGGLDSLFEIPFEGHRLSRDQVSMLETNFEDLDALVAKASKTVARPAKPAPVKPVPIPKPDPGPAAKSIAKPAPEAEPEIEIEPTKVTAVEPLDSDAVTADELIAATHAPVTSLRTTDEHTLKIGAVAGIGVGGRTFTPGSAAVPGYASAAVGMFRVAADIQPTRRMRLDVVAERSINMTTPLASGSAPTTFARWEATSAYLLSRGRLEGALDLGLGRRSFSVASTDPARSPDNSYNYLILGASVGAAFGDHLAIRGTAAFEPVMSGEEPMESSFGEARRWAVAVGGAVELRPRAHVVVRGGAEYQRFTWSWATAGNRSAGGAVDHYPAATLSVGAEY